jgi:hypothetical protein
MTKVPKFDTKFDTKMVDALAAAETGEIINQSVELKTTEHPVSLGDLFYELHALTWALEDECSAIDDVISAMKEKRAMKEEEFAPRMKELEEQIKDEILKHKKSFKCDYGSATFRKSYDRTSWDSKKLDGLAMLLPQILECKTVTKVEAGVSLKVGYNA